MTVGTVRWEWFFCKNSMKLCEKVWSSSNGFDSELDGLRSLLFEIIDVGDVVESLNLFGLEEESEFGHHSLEFEYSDKDFLEIDEFFIFF